MYKIIMSGIFGWEIMPFMIREQLNESNGGDVEFDLSSPGGSVFEGIEIFNMVRDHKRENPKSQMILNIKSEAASMGSYFASNPAFDLVTVEDNASWMAHNPLMGVIGDHNEMRKATNFLEGLAKMIVPSYANKSGQTIEQTTLMLDNESWLFGDEIVKAGFADEIMKTKKSKDRAAAISTAIMNFNEAMDRVKKREITKDEFSRVAAIVKNFIPVQGDNIKKIADHNYSDSNKPAIGGKNNNQEVIMNLDELKAKFPELYAEIETKIKESKQAGIDQEKERVKNLLEMKKKKDFDGIKLIHDRIDESIENGENVQDVHTAINAMSMKGGAVAAALDTNDVGNINTVDPDATASGEKGKPKNEDKGEF